MRPGGSSEPGGMPTSIDEAAVEPEDGAVDMMDAAFDVIGPVAEEAAAAERGGGAPKWCNDDGPPGKPGWLTISGEGCCWCGGGCCCC